jgi:glycosyltransferase involved in cell wall biosynthesis
VARGLRQDQGWALDGGHLVKVLILSWKDMAHPLAGGAEVYTTRVAERLTENGHDVTIFAAAVDGRPEREDVDGVHIVRRGSRWRVYAEARRFWKRQRAGSFDVVIDEVNTRPFLAPRYIRDVPVVGLMYQVAKEVWRYEMPAPVAVVGRHVLEPWWLRSYRDVPVMTISDSSARSLQEYGIRSSTVLPIGADEITPPDLAKETVPTVLFLGRLASNKRPEDAVEAVQSLRRSVPDARLWMMGDGPMRGALAAAHTPGVQVLGHVPWAERQRRLAAGHVLVATSVREGWGLNVSEAAAVGTPSIGYAVDGLRDSIPASGGLLVEPSPAALAAGLARFFAGDTTLTPTVSTVRWSEVGDAVERVLAAQLSEPATTDSKR